jgi:hypothetical protein
VYIVIVLRQDGYKDVLGMWLSESESAGFVSSIRSETAASMWAGEIGRSFALTSKKSLPLPSAGD